MALPAQGASYSPLVRGDVQVFKMLTAYWQKEHRDNGHTPSPKMIVWNPYRSAVSGALRLAGIKSWDLTPLSPETEYGIQGDLTRSPIRRESIHIAWSAERIDDPVMLSAMKAMVAVGGFLIAQLDCDWMGANLIQSGYFRLPFRWHGFEIFQKRRAYGGTNGREFVLEQSA